MSMWCLILQETAIAVTLGHVLLSQRASIEQRKCLQVTPRLSFLPENTAFPLILQVLNIIYTISRAINLILSGPDSPSDKVHIHCHRRFRFEFVECDNLTIANIIFNTCGSRPSTSSGTLIITTVTSLTVANVTVQHSHGYGLMGVRVSGNVTISHCKFFNNSRQRYAENSDNESISKHGWQLPFAHRSSHSTHCVRIRIYQWHC